MMADQSGNFDYTFCTLMEIGRSSGPSHFPHLMLRFNFSFQFQNTHWIQHLDSCFHAGDGLSFEDHTLAIIPVPGSSLPYDRIRDHIRRAIGDRVSTADRNRLVETACKEVADHFAAKETLPRFSLYTLDFKIRIDLYRVLHVDGMVAAADSSLGMPDKTSSEADANSCCICLEELGGGEELTKMPCSHVFHGGCIQEWLKTSLYCPLCRARCPPNGSSQNK